MVGERQPGRTLYEAELYFPSNYGSRMATQGYGRVNHGFALPYLIKPNECTEICPSSPDPVSIYSFDLLICYQAFLRCRILPTSLCCQTLLRCHSLLTSSFVVKVFFVITLFRHPLAIKSRLLSLLLIAKTTSVVEITLSLFTENVNIRIISF